MGIRAKHGMLKFKCGMTVPPPCLALLCQENIPLYMENIQYRIIIDVIIT